LHVAPVVGVLALQGASNAHRSTFAKLGIEAREVRNLNDLEGLTHLVLPGGESTTIHHLLELFDLRQPIIERYRERRLALFGTCAGAILLGQGDGEPPPRFGLLDAVLERNAYGRQTESFSRGIRFESSDPEDHCAGLHRFGLHGSGMHGVFIRAPKVSSVGPAARVLAWDGTDPILLQGRGLLAATFHPELTGDPRLHAYFLLPELWQAAEPAQREPLAASRS
ncbi:MAG: pyridoxal 5'-phosphate synthase glutaminase subunit PdxT, partial [Acidobacteriota bacterium]